MENMDKGLIVKKWVSQKYPKCPKIYLPNLSVHDQKFWISLKKGFIWRPYSVVLRKEFQDIRAYLSQF